MIEREIWYDWDGKNLEFFNKMYDANPPLLVIDLIHFFHKTAAYSAFPYWLAIFTLFSGFMCWWNISKKKLNSKQQIKQAFFFILAMISSYAAMSFAIDFIKEYYGFLRPYAQIDGVVAHIAYGQEQAARSFPSGHAAFATFIVVSSWVRLHGLLKIAGIFFIIGSCWSRIAAGVHFPVDVLTGFLIALIVTLITQSIIYSFYPLHKRLDWEE